MTHLSYVKDPFWEMMVWINSSDALCNYLMIPSELCSGHPTPDISLLLSSNPLKSWHVSNKSSFHLLLVYILPVLPGCWDVSDALQKVIPNCLLISTPSFLHYFFEGNYSLQKRCIIVFGFFFFPSKCIIIIYPGSLCSSNLFTVSEYTEERKTTTKEKILWQNIQFRIAH